MNDDSDTPTSQVAAAAKTEVKVADERGRIISVRKLNALNYYMLTKAMGNDASNEALMDLAITAAAVRRIDTQDFAFPAREQDVRVLLQLLDFDGIKAAGEGLRQLHAKAVDDGTEAAKNSRGDQTSV